MRRHRDLGTMAERSAATRAGAEAPPPHVRHCWVTGPRGTLPGLLLTWERRAGGWYGRVAHPVHEPEGWVIVEEWLPAELLGAA